MPTSSVWAALAVLVGLLVATLPLALAGGIIALVGLVLIILIEPTLALVLMLSVAPLKTLIATEAPVAFPADVGQMLFALTVGAWVVWRVTQRRFNPLPRTRIYVALAGIMLAFSVSLFNAASPGAWLSEMLKWVEITLLVLIALDLGRSRWEWIAFGVILAAGLQALIGLYEFRGGSGAPHLWIAGFRFFRAFGTFGQPNPFSAFLGLSLPLALGLAWGYFWRAYGAFREGSVRTPFNWAWPGLLAAGYAGASLLLLAGILASWGRGAWLGFGAAGVVMVCFAPRQRWLGFALVGMGGVVVSGLWIAGLVPLSIQQRLENATTEFVGFQDVRATPVSDENFAIVERLAHWQAAINMANDNPLIGVGLGNYEQAYPDYRVPSWPRALGHAHNDYLNILAETGVIGLIGYLIGWAALAAWTLRALRQRDPLRRGVALGLLGVWTHLAIHSIVDKLYVNNIFLHIGVMLGLLAVTLRDAEAEHEYGII